MFEDELLIFGLAQLKIRSALILWAEFFQLPDLNPGRQIKDRQRYLGAMLSPNTLLAYT